MPVIVNVSRERERVCVGNGRDFILSTIKFSNFKVDSISLFPSLQVTILNGMGVTGRIVNKVSFSCNHVNFMIAECTIVIYCVFD